MEEEGKVVEGIVLHPDEAIIERFRRYKESLGAEEQTVVKSRRGRKNEERAEFLRWFGLSEIDKVEAGLPTTMVGIAKHLNVTPDTIRAWVKVVRRQLPQLEEEKEEEEWAKFMVHLRKQALREGAPAAVMDLYAVLKGKKIEQMVVKIGLSADELARQSLIAQRQLKDGGY